MSQLLKHWAATVTYKENVDNSLVHIFQEWRLELSLRTDTVTFVSKFCISAPTYTYCCCHNMKY